MKIRPSTALLAVAAVLPCAAPIASAQEKLAEAVVVTATRQTQRADEVLASTEIIEREQIERAGHSSLIEVLQAVPGVQVTSNGGAGSSSSVYVRGAEARHTLLLVDGLRVGSATSGAAALEGIPLASVERIEILRGPASALYGSEAIGGVIQIFTRSAEAGFHPEVALGYGSYGSFKGTATVAGGAERLRYSLSAGQERVEGFNAKRDPALWTSGSRTSYWADKDGFDNDFLSGRLTLGLRAQDEIGLSFLQADGRNRYDASGTRYFDSRIDKRTTVTGAHVRTSLGEGWTSTLRLGQTEEGLLNRASASAPTRFDTRQDQLAWQHDVALPLGSLMLAYEHVDSRVRSTTAYRERSRQVDSALIGWSARVEDHHLQLNGRHDDNSQFGGKTTGLFAYGYDLDRAWQLRASIATAFNAPTFNQLYSPKTASGYEGNPELRPERALNRELGLRWRQGGQMVEASYFNNRVEDLIPVNATGQQQNSDRATLEGVELAWQLALRDYDFAAGFQYLDATVDGRELLRRAPRSAFLRIGHRVERLSWGLELFGAGRRYDDLANTVALSGYGLLNAYAHYRLDGDWRLEARANNLLDRDYELARGYATPGANLFVGVRYAPR